MVADVASIMYGLQCGAEKISSENVTQCVVSPVSTLGFQSLREDVIEDARKVFF